MKIRYWKFSDRAAPKETAEKIADDLATGNFPRCDGRRFHNVAGWVFDIGRKPYLIESHDGSIYRRWARTIGELRRDLHLNRMDKVIRDPFDK